MTEYDTTTKGDNMTSAPDPFPWESAFDDAPTPVEVQHVGDAPERPDVVLDGIATDPPETDDPNHAGDPPAPELSDEERATVERFESAPDAVASIEHAEAAPDALPGVECVEAVEVDDADHGPTMQPCGEPAVAWAIGPEVGQRYPVCEKHDDVVYVEIVGEPTVEPTAEVVPRGMVLDVDGVLDELADTVTRTTTTRTMRDAIVNTIRVRADERRKAREERLDGKPVKDPTQIRRELVGAANDSDVLADLAAVFTAGAKEAKGVAGDLLLDLPQRNTQDGPKPRASTKVGDGEGFELTVSRSASKELKVDTSALHDVLAAWLLSAAERRDDSPIVLGKMPAVTYAAGVRDALAMLGSLLGATPGYKVTALNSLVTEIQNADDDALAERLRAAFGQVEKGEASVKLERKPVKPKGGDQ